MNPYKVLGVRPNASLDEIKDAYESLANTYNINNFDGSLEEPLAEDKLSEINEAYKSLTNNFKYQDIRSLIENKQFLTAETESPPPTITVTPREASLFAIAKVPSA